MRCWSSDAEGDERSYLHEDLEKKVRYHGWRFLYINYLAGAA